MEESLKVQQLMYKCIVSIQFDVFRISGFILSTWKSGENHKGKEMIYRNMLGEYRLRHVLYS